MSIALVPSRFIPRARMLRRVTVVGAAATAMLLLAGPALAHVTVSPSSVPAGSASELTFRVPNEEAHANTVKVDVQIPTQHPIAQLLVKPVPGWTISVKSITLAKPVTTDDGTFNSAVSEVIWTGGQILPGQFQDFAISADPLPAGISQLVFKAIQTYSNGDVVRWIDLPQPGQPAPAHPAPTLTLTTGTATTTGPASTVHTSAAPAATASGTDGLSRALGVAGLLVGLLACLLALMVARRSRRLVADGGPLAGAPAANGRPEAAGEQGSDGVLTGAKASAGRNQAPAGGKASARRTVPANAKSSSRQTQRRRRG